MRTAGALAAATWLGAAALAPTVSAVTPASAAPTPATSVAGRDTAVAGVPRAPRIDAIRGRRLPRVTLRDEHGRAFRLAELAGRPLVLSLVFARCPHACPMITRSLRDALGAIGPPGPRYGVLTLSFDPADTPDDLAALRRRHALPEGWRLATGDSADVAALLAALDFGVVRVAGGFAHPNGVFVLDDSLRVDAWLSGLSFDTDALRRALGHAMVGPGRSLVRRARPLLALVAALGAIATLLAIRLTRDPPTA